MPCRYIVKKYDTNTYYHVYNRGVEKRAIFIDDQDYSVFIDLLKRYLDPSEHISIRGTRYCCLVNDVNVIAFCLMPNHFHLLLYQVHIGGVTNLLRAVCSSYSTYFNKKYSRIGALFQNNFKAIAVNNDGYLQYLCRYIHRNPPDYLCWEWSSLRFWTNDKTSTWLNSARLSNMSSDQYLEYLADDNSFNRSVDEIECILLDNREDIARGNGRL